MRADDVRSSAPVRHGAYVCLTTDALWRIDDSAVPLIADRLGLCNEFLPGTADQQRTIAYLRKTAVRPATKVDARLEHAAAVVHVAASTAAPVTAFCAEVRRLLGPNRRPAILAGVVRPMTYTSNAMYNF